MTKFNTIDQSGKMILLKADFHFSEVKVIESSNPLLIGINGIIIRDNKFTFKIITKENKVKTIPKSVSVFQFIFGRNKIQIYGNSIIGVPEERLKQKHIFETNFKNNKKLIKLI